MLLNLEWFRTFKTIYETGSLTTTANTLYISQPGVSLHLSSLEGYVGYKLFERSPRKMVPTERAKILYASINDALVTLESAEQHFHKSAQPKKATITIGMCLETFQFTLEQHISALPFNVSIKFGEYPEMIKELENGLLDLIVTPQKSNHVHLEYKPFSKERIVLVAGGKQDTKALDALLKKKKLDDAEAWVKDQIWYSTASDMENLQKFWSLNFKKQPDFRPNYILPNKCSIVRCLTTGKGFAVIPDFLCRHELQTGKLKLAWPGDERIENTLYFGKRKRTMFAKEIALIESFFREEA